MKYIVKVLALNAGKNIFRSGEEVEGRVFGNEKLAKLIKGGYLTPVESESVKTPAKTKAEIAAEKKAAEKAEKERLKAEAEELAAEQARLAAESADSDNDNEFKSHSDGAINLKDNDL